MTQAAMIKALKDAIEGECDGLGITDETAKAILDYVLPSGQPSFKQISEVVSEWAEKHYVAFVSRSYGLATIDTVSLDALHELAKAAAQLKPETVPVQEA